MADLKQRRRSCFSNTRRNIRKLRDLNSADCDDGEASQSNRGPTRSQSIVRTNLETRYRQAQQKEQALREALISSARETLTQNEAAVNYRIIQQEIETNKTLAGRLLQRAKENDVILAGTPNNIHVVDHAARPKVPVESEAKTGNRSRCDVLLSFLALLWLVILTTWTIPSDTSEDVENFLRLPALAVIPSLGSLTRRRLLSAMPGGNKKNGNHAGEELLLNASHRSSLAESYRQLRTSVLLSSAGGAPRTLLVTSSQPGEGKTTTVVNIATTWHRPAPRW